MNIIEENYLSTVNRGKISEDTTKLDFIQKLDEELNEFTEAVVHELANEAEELADIILVCYNYARHYGIDIKQELINKITKNQKRND